MYGYWQLPWREQELMHVRKWNIGMIKIIDIHSISVYSAVWCQCHTAEIDD